MAPEALTFSSKEQAELVSAVQEVLRATAFFNRYTFSPDHLDEVGQEEVATFLRFLAEPEAVAVEEWGAKRAEEGLGEEAVLRLGAVLRRFCLTHLVDDPPGTGLEAAEAYTCAFLEGFMAAREAIVLDEQERIRAALQHALDRHTLQLQTAAEVTQVTASILDLDELLSASVDLICDRFAFYYVGIFLVDEAGGGAGGDGAGGDGAGGEWAVLRAGSGEAGQEMLRQGHKLRIGGKSMIGQCIAREQPRVALNVREEAARFDNPLLPETRSEMALPLTARGQLIGAVTIQSDRIAAFRDTDITTLQTLAGQLANALENARLFAQVQAAVTEMEAVHRRYLHQEWASFQMEAEARQRVAFTYERATAAIAPAGGVWAPEMDRAVREGRVVAIDDEAVGRAALAAPLELRGETIGALNLYETEQERQWSEDDIALVEAVSAQAAIALENVRLFEEAQTRAHREQVLRETLAVINASEDLSADLAAVAQHLRALVPVDVITLATYTPGEDEYTLFAVGAETEAGHFAHRGLRLPVEGTGPGWAIAHGQPWLEADIRLDKPFAEDEQLLAEGLVSRLLLPLQVGQQVVGTLNLASKHPGTYTEASLPILRQVADQFALALERDRLFHEAQRRAEEQAILNEMSQALAACQDIDSVLEQAYAGALRLLDASGFYITLYDSKSDEVTLAIRVIDEQVEMPRTTRLIGRGGLADYLLETRKPLLLPDRLAERIEELGLAQIPPLAGRTPESWLGAPIMIGDQVLGAMVVLSYTTSHAYDEHSQDLLVAAANQTALALQNVRSLEETQAALAEVEAAHRSYLRQAWQDHLRQREILERSGFYYDRSQATRPAGAIAAPDLWLPEMERALADGRLAVASSEDDGEERSGLAMPITIRGETIGVLGVEMPSEDYQWTEEDRLVVAAVGEQLAQALESARLFADTQRRAERERLIGEITAKIRASTDVRHILQTAAVELGQVLGTSRALVRLGLTEEQGNEE